LYDFPLIETEQRLSEEKFLSSKEWKKFIGNTIYTITSVSREYKHLLSHQKIYARFWELTCKTSLNPLITKGSVIIPEKELHLYAVPRLIDQYLQSQKQYSLSISEE
jgi:A/G-specific adenine glycosylase